MAEAKKKEKSANSFFQRVTGSGSAVNDEARELYIQAGNAAKAEGNYPMSVEAYEKALNLSSEDYEKTAMYEAIGSSYKMFDLPKAIPALTRAAELQMSQGKWTMASQILEKIAEFYEELNDQENMLKTLKEACRFLKQEGQKASVNRVQKKIAESYILQGKFIDAQQDYEEMANKSKDDSMLKYNAKELWFRLNDFRDKDSDRREFVLLFDSERVFVLFASTSRIWTRLSTVTWTTIRCSKNARSKWNFFVN